MMLAIKRERKIHHDPPLEDISSSLSRRLSRYTGGMRALYLVFDILDGESIWAGVFSADMADIF